ncbi:phage terminase large subunit [Bradyrhizobium brasilense]|uniref:phage terminase large subunit n=1 Tax=Bradyrhizobium brasilense TaxID=1419277 RepID=UPI0030B8BCB2
MAAIRAERQRRQTERERERLARDADAIRARCQTLAGFFREAWHVLEPNTPLIWNWHLDALCEHLEAITAGRINRFLANVIPGSSKSMAVSVMWQAWEWGPKGLRSMRYLTTAFNDGPVKRDTRKCRDLILSTWYQALWPEVELTRTGETSFANSSTGTREGVAFGSLTSQRGDRLVIDDPHSTETAESETERNNTTRKFREGALNRLNDQERSAIVVIMQRLHEDDISGVILKLKMGYVHLMLPMEFEPERRCTTSIGFTDPRTADGELLDPVRFSRDTVDNLKRDTTQYAYSGQYQQRPSPREGGMFKRHWFEFVPAAPAATRWCRGWDLAASKKKPQTASGPAYTAGVRLGVAAGVYYIGHSVRERASPAEVDALIKNTATQDGTAVRISIPQDPGQAAKGQVLAFAKLLAGFDVRFSVESGDKTMRALPVSAQAEVGNVKIIKTGDPARDAWIEPLLDELGIFPAGTFKDQADALSRAFAEALAMALVPDVNIGSPVQVSAGAVSI